MSEHKTCKVKIVGATGYTGGELIRLLLTHPHVEITSLTGAGIGADQPIFNFWSWLRNICDLKVSEEKVGDPQGADVVFLSVPHGVSMKLAPAYLEKGCKVIDLSADYRFRDLSIRDAWYDGEHTSPELCQTAAYGMPELFREEIKTAQLIANPGCYPTTVILGLYPAIREGLIQADGIHVNSATGVTGAGKKANLIFHHPELDQNYFAYRIGKHQHCPEMIDILSRATGKDVSLAFVPHVLPLQRGILSTMYCRKAGGASVQEIWEVYQNMYKNEQFVRLYPLGKTPDLQGVRMSNFVDISIHEDVVTGDVIILSAEDNLVKGAAGQAVQNLNVMMGYPEKYGLLPS
ncbi:MAG: N-acetyl-gamma-glutamyl-phosphate reductase [Candidatus Hinthialibacter sp.]